VLKLYNIKRVSANIIAKSLGDGAEYCIYGICVNECFEWIVLGAVEGFVG
jgi:hypothetical protein